jgi:NADPH:quinone reductase-like Zn-dependent oxidoreductase
MVRSIGADHVIDYTSEDFAESGTTYDLIIDIAGNSSLARLRRAAAPKGTIVITGGETDGRWLGGADRQLRGMALSPFVRQRLTTFVGKVNAAALERLTSLIEDGRVVPVIERTFPLVDVPVAMRHLESGKARGKLVITV